MEMTHHGQGVFPHIESEISHRESRSFEICQLSKAEGGKAAVAKASSDTCDLPWDGERAYPSRVTKRSRLKRIRYSATWGNLDWRR